MPPSSSENLHEIYSHHCGWLKQWLFKGVSCKQTAEDLSHDTFEQAIKANKASELRSPRAYLLSIAKTLTINLYRRRSIEEAYLQALASLPLATAASPQQHHENMQTLADIDAALCGVHGKVRHTFLLSRLEGLTYAEIAKRIGVSERTVKNYMAQAMLCCVEVLEGDDR